MVFLLRMEINIIAIMILLMLLFNTRQDTLQILDDKLFRILLYISLLWVVLDTAAWAVDGRQFLGARFLIIALNIMYFIACVLLPYAWLLYAEFRITYDEKELWRSNRLLILPLLLFIVITVLTPLTGWVFYVDEFNIYHRGPLYFVQLLLSVFYLLWPTVRSLNRARRQSIWAERVESYNLASFVIWPIGGAIVQLFFYGLPVVSFATVFAELLIFVNVQNKQISMDALTRINNRGQLNRYLNIVTKSYRQNRKLYMLLIDIDHFKEINDTYGHDVGDRAIQKTAELLKRVCGQFQAFLARYGGDEFAVVLECSAEADVERLIHDIKLEFEQFNRGDSVPYKLALSIGCAEYGLNQINTVDRLVEEADNQMYMEKANRKSRGL